MEREEEKTHFCELEFKDMHCDCVDNNNNVNVKKRKCWFVNRCSRTGWSSEDSLQGRNQLLCQWRWKDARYKRASSSQRPLFYWKSDHQKSTLSITQYKIPASKFEPTPLSSVLEGRRIQEAIIISTYRHCLRFMFFLSYFWSTWNQGFLCHWRCKSVEYKRPTFCQGPVLMMLIRFVELR